MGRIFDTAISGADKAPPRARAGYAPSTQAAPSRKTRSTEATS